jgi:hypothetical protein
MGSKVKEESVARLGSRRSKTCLKSKAGIKPETIFSKPDARTGNTNLHLNEHIKWLIQSLKRHSTAISHSESTSSDHNGASHPYHTIQIQLILLSKINQQIKNYFLSCFSSTMSTASNYSTFQVSGDESKYVHPTNFSYFQFPEDHQTS